MRRLSSFNLRIIVVAWLLALLATVQVADFGALIDSPAPRGPRGSAEITPVTVDEAVEQAIGKYSYARYANVVEASIFAVNAVKMPEPVKVIEPPPPPPPPPPSPKPEPKPPMFTANLEVTGIAITPERKLVMVWDKKKKETHVLSERESIRRWRVVSIDKQRVVLRHPLGGRYEFTVNEETLVEFNN